MNCKHVPRAHSSGSRSEASDKEAKSEMIRSRARGEPRWTPAAADSTWSHSELVWCCGGHPRARRECYEKLHVIGSHTTITIQLSVCVCSSSSSSEWLMTRGNVLCGRIVSRLLCRTPVTTPLAGVLRWVYYCLLTRSFILQLHDSTGLHYAGSAHSFYCTQLRSVLNVDFVSV